MKKTLIRASSFLLTLSLLVSLLVPAASAINYEGVESITVDATAAFLIDLDTDQVLYEQEADQQRYPASITKIMTALLTLEAVGRGELDLSTEITVDAAALADITDDSSTVYLKAGEVITVENLLYCLLVSSANEASNILAMAVAGDIPTFVEQMNQRAQELGMTGTHFANPHGLHDPDHYSTAWDIYRMTKQAMTHSTFREIVSTAYYTVPATNLSAERDLINTNALLTSTKYPGYTYSGTIGVKTGSTGQAGFCLVAAAKKSGHTLVSVVLGAENPTDSNGNVTQRKQFSESRKLLDWGFTNFSAATLLDADTYLQEIPVRFSPSSSHVVLQPTRSVKVLVPGEYDAERLELRLKLNSDVASAPITKGDVLGTVTVIYAGEEYATVDMTAVTDVSFSPFVAFVTSVNTVLGNIYVRLLLLVALVLVVIGFIRRFQEHTREERRAKRQQRQQEKIAFRQREAEARQADEAWAKQEKEAREARRKEDLLRRQQEAQERQAKRAQEAQERHIRREQERLEREERQRQLRAEREARQAQERQRRQEERAERERLAAERRQREEEERRAREARRQEEQARRRQEERAEREHQRRREQAERERRQRQQELDRRSQRHDPYDRRSSYYEDYDRPRRQSAPRDARRGSPSGSQRRRPDDRR